MRLRTTGRSLLLLAVFAAGCSKKPAPTAVDGGVRPGVPAPATSLQLSCVEKSPERTLLLGRETNVRDPEDQELSEPFGVTLGSALDQGDGVIVAALESRGNATHAILGLLGHNADQGRFLELGRVYGDAEPPRLVRVGHTVVVILPDTDAAGPTLRLGTLTEQNGAPTVAFHSTTSVGRDESMVFSAVATEGKLMLVWDELDGKRRSVLRGFVTEPRHPHPKPELFGASPNAEFEGPRASPRPGGAWLGALRLSAKPSTPNPTDDEGELRPLAPEHRSLELWALDAAGHRLGSPIAPLPNHQHIVTFELGTLPDGTALIAARDENASPGVESGALLLTRVHHDGTLTHTELSDERLGAGGPSLLVDPKAPPERAVLLAIASLTGPTLLVYLDAEGKPRGTLTEAPRLGAAEPWLRRDTELLVARPVGGQEELGWLTCTPQP